MDRRSGNRRFGNRRFGFAAGALFLLGTACAGEDSPTLFALAAFAGGPCGSAYLADVEDEFRLDVDLSTPGASPAIVFEMAIPGFPGDQILLTREIVITLPASFGFAGFDALGPGAQIGQWDFDFGSDLSYDPPADYTIPHRAISANEAYADTRLNGTYDPGIDSTATHSTGGGGEHVFTVTLPSGGTNNNGAGGNCSYFDTDTRFTLPAGIVTLPSTPGSYDVAIRATSVDPDTGDQDDGQGTDPTVYQRVVPINVPEPGGAAAALAGIAALRALTRRRAARGDRA
jgi:hypothetical protein